MRSVTKKYGAVTAVKNLTLDITAGTYCCLLGSSGCGKTTALRMLAGHNEATSKDILIETQQVNDIPAAKRNTARMFQSYALFPHKTIWENVEFGLKMRKLKELVMGKKIITLAMPKNQIDSLQYPLAVANCRSFYSDIQFATLNNTKYNLGRVIQLSKKNYL